MENTTDHEQNAPWNKGVLSPMPVGGADKNLDFNGCGNWHRKFEQRYK